MKTVLFTFAVILVSTFSIFAQGGYNSSNEEYPVYDYRQDLEDGSYVIKYVRHYYPSSEKVPFKFEYFTNEGLKYQELHAFAVNGDSTIYEKTFNHLGETESFESITVDLKGGFVKSYIRTLHVLDENDIMASYTMFDFYDVNNDLIDHENSFSSPTKSYGGSLIKKSKATEEGISRSVNVEEHHARIKSDAEAFFRKYFGEPSADN